MRKNKMMRLASALLVAVLLTTCAISGTFAKYVTTDYTEDTARVAKWGVTIAGTKGLDNTMFSDSYKDTPMTYVDNEAGDAITVQASTAGTNIVAPGTESTLSAFDISGTPEVDVEVTYVAALTLTGWEVDSAYYCPIEITVGTDTFKGTTYSSAADFEAAVEAAIVAKTAKYDTNTDLSAVEDDLVVTWKWAFEGNDDAKDTALGDAAAATIALRVDITITQVD